MTTYLHDFLSVRAVAKEGCVSTARQRLHAQNCSAFACAGNLSAEKHKHEGKETATDRQDNGPLSPHSPPRGRSTCVLLGLSKKNEFIEEWHRQLN